MVKYWDRLKPEMDARRLDITGLSKALDISFQAVAKVRDGGSFGSKNNLNAAKFFGVSPEWLATGKGGKLAATVHENAVKGPSIKGLIPVISWIQAGAWCEASDPFQPGEADDWMPCPVAHSSNTFALRVRGDSMTAPTGNSRTYPEGCIIFVDPAKSMPNNGDRIIAKLVGSDEVTFKVYKEEDGRRWLQPLNPTHLPIREEFTVCGTVIGKWEDG